MSENTSKLARHVRHMIEQSFLDRSIPDIEPHYRYRLDQIETELVQLLDEYSNALSKQIMSLVDDRIRRGPPTYGPVPVRPPTF